MKHLKHFYALCILIATLTLHSADVSAITFPIKSDLYVGAGPLIGNSNVHFETPTDFYGIGLAAGGNFYNVNLEGRVNHGTLHLRPLIGGPIPECKWSYTISTGYSFHLFQQFSITPQVGLQWHTGALFKCENPRAIGALRLHYAFNKHWGIANGIESDFKDTWADYLHLVYTF